MFNVSMFHCSTSNGSGSGQHLVAGALRVMKANDTSPGFSAVEQLVARLTHNQEVEGSSPSRAIRFYGGET